MQQTDTSNLRDCEHCRGTGKVPRHWYWVVKWANGQTKIEVMPNSPGGSSKIVGDNDMMGHVLSWHDNRVAAVDAMGAERAD